MGGAMLISGTLPSSHTVVGGASLGRVIVDGPAKMDYKDHRFEVNGGPNVQLGDNAEFKATDSEFTTVPAAAKSRGASVGWTPGYSLHWLKGNDET